MNFCSKVSHFRVPSEINDTRSHGNNFALTFTYRVRHKAMHHACRVIVVFLEGEAGATKYSEQSGKM